MYSAFNETWLEPESPVIPKADEFRVCADDCIELPMLIFDGLWMTAGVVSTMVCGICKVDVDVGFIIWL